MFLNKADLVDADVVELVEIEVRELLEEHGFDPDSPVVAGSAALALKGDDSPIGEPSIRKLVETLDAYLTPPVRDFGAPFLFPIDNFFTVPGRGTVVTGTLSRGSVKKLDPAVMIGFDQTKETVISDLQVGS